MAAKNYHINLEVKRMQLALASKGLVTDNRVSKRNVPYILVEGKVSMCFFWGTKQWKAFDWLSADNRTLTQKDKGKMEKFILDYFKEDLEARYELYILHRDR
jgi:hypothetical protein